MISFRIPISGLKQSTNKFYAGQHWSKRKEFKDSVFDYARAFCRKSGSIGRYPVEIRYRFIFESRALDTLNTAIIAKCFEDALRSLGILKDDSPAYVARSVLEVVAVSAQVPGGSKANQTRLKRPVEDWLIIEIKEMDFLEKNQTDEK